MTKRVSMFWWRANWQDDLKCGLNKKIGCLNSFHAAYFLCIILIILYVFETTFHIVKKRIAYDRQPYTRTD